MGPEVFQDCFLGNYFVVADFTIYLEMVEGTCIMDFICFLIYHIQTLRS